MAKVKRDGSAELRRLTRDKHKGAISELIACAWLLKEGWEVFRNTSAHGPADLVLWRPSTNEIRFVDVNTAIKSSRAVGYKQIKAPPQSRHAGVLILSVFEDGHCEWS